MERCLTERASGAGSTTLSKPDSIPQLMKKEGFPTGPCHRPLLLVFVCGGYKVHHGANMMKKNRT